MLDKEFEMKVATAVCFLRFNCAVENVGSSSKATHQLCAASKSILTWNATFRAKRAILAHPDTSDSREHNTYLHEECVGAAKRVFRLNFASHIVAGHVNTKHMLLERFQTWAICDKTRKFIFGASVRDVRV